MIKDAPRIRARLSARNEPDREVDVPRDTYLYWTFPDGTEIKVEMVDGQLMIWNQGNTALFSLSVQPVSSNVVKIAPTQ